MFENVLLIYRVEFLCFKFDNWWAYFPLQHQGQVLNDTVDGKEIYNTIRHKTKDAFYKNIVKKGYLLKKSEYGRLLRIVMDPFPALLLLYMPAFLSRSSSFVVILC